MSKLKSVSKIDDLHELVEITEGLNQCQICLLPANPEDIKVGPLYKLGDCQAHIRCLWFSSALEQKGEDEEGIKGFLYEDIMKEYRRGSRLKCFYCPNKNATTGCCVKKCKKSYHFPCGQKAGAMFQFYGEFNSFCETHRPVQAPSVHKGEEVEEEDQCGVCLDEMEERISPATLWTPCCGGWFHRSCVEKMAENSGLSFFKCPLCNNKETFEKEMLEHGVYIPNQDAEWEKDNAYEDLYQRHNSCDVEVCVCPDGRLRDDENNDDSPWEIFLCRSCGHQGSHITCGNLDFEFPMFECQSCLDIVRKQCSPPRPVFHPNSSEDDYECGFSTKVLDTMSNHIKRHHAATTTTKIKHIKKPRDENGNTHLPRQQRSSDLNFTDETFPEPIVIKNKVSCIQEADNKEEAFIVISDDEEELVTPKTTETDGNCREFPSVIVSDDDESMTPWKPGSAKKKTLTKRFFSDFPLPQNQICNGGLNTQDKMKGEVNEPLKMLRRLGPGITITKTISDISTKTTSDNLNTEKTKKAIDKIRKLGPAISFSRANE